MYYGQPRVTQQAPLPAGWEAKYDPSSRKWFYLNHQTKTTQWDDPRLTLQQQPHAYKQPTFNLMPQHHGNMGKPAPVTTSFIEADPLKVDAILHSYEISKDLAHALLRTHSNHLDKVENSLKEMGYKKKEIVVAKTHLVERLMRDYPTAPKDKIIKQLVQRDNNLQGARMDLEAIGYRKKSVAIIPQPAMKKTPVKKVIPSKTAAQKQQDRKKAFETLKRKFSELDKDVIELCLEVANYDVAMASEILASKVEEDKQKKTRNKARSSYVSTEDTGPRNMEPVVFGDEPSTSSATIPAFNVEVHFPSDSKQFLSSTSVFTEAAAKPTPVVRTKQHQHQQKKSIIKSMPRNDVYKSALRIEPVGPNAALCKGPDASLLLKTYVEKLGPNKASRKGPQETNRKGPQSMNRKGPAGISVGPAGFANMI